MKTSQQTEANQHPKRRGYRFWHSFLPILLLLPILLYYGYCWGLWGRQSLLLQYLFQCSCPPASEEARYPEEVDVIIPACRNIDVTTRLSPSGRFLYIREGNHELASAYFLDLQTMERIEVTDQPFSSFLTDDLLFVGSGLQAYIIDRIHDVQYPIQKFEYSRPDAEINGEINLVLLAESLRKADNVFLVGASTDTVVALVSDFHMHPEQNFIANRFDIPDFNMEQFLQENGIIYRIILPDFLDEAISPNGRLVARPDGIYLIESNKKIVEGYSLSVRGWAYDGHGAIYSHHFGHCLMWINFPFADDKECFFRVAQPVLLLKVPQEYLMSVQTP